MKFNPWFIIFLIVLAGDLTGILLKDENWQYIFKPLIVPAVTANFLSAWTGKNKKLQVLVLSALFFSWAGDILLMFESRDEIYFLLGLSAFLIAHLFYIAFFHQLRTRGKISVNNWLLLFVAVYYTSLILLLTNYLGDKEWPVRIYGIVISFMLFLALHMNRLPGKQAGIMMMTGASLFVISDSLLAINKFYFAFEGAGLLVMITYAIAQWLIATGAARYLHHLQKG